MSVEKVELAREDQRVSYSSDDVDDTEGVGVWRATVQCSCTQNRRHLAHGMVVLEESMEWVDKCSGGGRYAPLGSVSYLTGRMCGTGGGRPSRSELPTVRDWQSEGHKTRGQWGTTIVIEQMSAIEEGQVARTWTRTRSNESKRAQGRLQTRRMSGKGAWVEGVVGCCRTKAML
jgi:hypothetical protein